MLGTAKVPAQEQPYLLGHKPPQLVSSSKNIWRTLCTAALPLVRTSGSWDLTDIAFELVKLGLILWSEHTAQFITMNRLLVIHEQRFSYLLQIHASMSVRCCEGEHSSCSMLSASCRYRPSTKGQDAASTRTRHTHTHTQQSHIKAKEKSHEQRHSGSVAPAGLFLFDRMRQQSKIKKKGRSRKTAVKIFTSNKSATRSLRKHDESFQCINEPLTSNCLNTSRSSV